MEDNHEDIEELVVQKRKWEEDLINYKGKDPLSIWKRYIGWAKRCYLTANLRGEFLTLLERCTKQFQNDSRYTNDERYLQIWLAYADACAEPIDVFIHLQKNNIGKELTLFYETWANFLENRADYKEATEIYQLGITNNANPLEKLQDQFLTFQARMERRLVLLSPESNKFPQSPNQKNSSPNTEKTIARKKEAH